MAYNLKDEKGNPIHPFILFYRDFKAYFPLWVPYVNDTVANYMEWSSGVPAKAWLQLQAEWSVYQEQLRLKSGTPA